MTLWQVQILRILLAAALAVLVLVGLRNWPRRHEGEQEG